MNSDPAKVSPNHLHRDAYLYVRQSTLRQVVENTESTQRQYALRERAIALGWPIERVQVIDCDQGQSGASAADREGFQRLVAEVSLGHAGIVLGLEVSRLARNNSDWHRLLEICALTGTLILDEDGLYDPEPIQRSFIAWFEGDDLGGRAACPAGAAPRRNPEQGAAGGTQDAAARRTWSTIRRAGWSWIQIAKSRMRCGPCSPPMNAPARAARPSSTSGNRACCSRDGCVAGFAKGNWSGGRSSIRGCCKCCITRGTPALSSMAGLAGVGAAMAARLVSDCRPKSGTRCYPRPMRDTSPGTSTSATSKALRENAQAHGR